VVNWNGREKRKNPEEIYTAQASHSPAVKRDNGSVPEWEKKEKKRIEARKGLEGGATEPKW